MIFSNFRNATACAPWMSTMLVSFWLDGNWKVPSLMGTIRNCELRKKMQSAKAASRNAALLRITSAWQDLACVISQSAPSARAAAAAPAPESAARGRRTSLQGTAVHGTQCVVHESTEGFLYVNLGLCMKKLHPGRQPFKQASSVSKTSSSFAACQITQSVMSQ